MTMVPNKVMVFRRRSALSPINSVKHIIDSEGELTGANTSFNVIAIGVPNVDTTTFKPGDIRTGAKINGFFISVFMIGATGTGTDGSLNWILQKTHSGQSGTIPALTGTSTLRNQIIHEEKGLSGSADGTPMVFKGVIAVPKGMRRMREDDQWLLSLRSTDATNNTKFCIKVIYKSYF